jgi:hypothetical protein
VYFRGVCSSLWCLTRLPLSYLRASQKTTRRLMQAGKRYPLTVPSTRRASNACPCLLDERPRESSGTSICLCLSIASHGIKELLNHPQEHRTGAVLICLIYFLHVLTDRNAFIRKRPEGAIFPCSYIACLQGLRLPSRRARGRDPRCALLPPVLRAKCTPRILTTRSGLVVDSLMGNFLTPPSTSGADWRTPSSALCNGAVTSDRLAASANKQRCQPRQTCKTTPTFSATFDSIFGTGVQPSWRSG